MKKRETEPFILQQEWKFFCGCEMLGYEPIFEFLKHSFLLKKSDLETSFFELLDFLYITFFERKRSIRKEKI